MGETAKALNETDALFGERIKQYRVYRGVSQEALGRICGCTFQQIQKYERGLNRVSIGRACRIAEALGTSVEAMLELPVEEIQHEIRYSALATALDGLEPTRRRRVLDAFHTIVAAL